MEYYQKIGNLSLKKICHSGQCFRMWKKKEAPKSDVDRKQMSGNSREGDPADCRETYQLIAGSRWLEISQSGDRFWFSCSREAFETFWSSYFDLETDYDQVIRRIDSSDRYLRQAADYGYGIRILRQDLWEMIVTFIISQQNNIRRIRRCIETICEAYGSRCTAPDGTVYYGFPTPAQLSRATEEELRALNLGYRSRYLVRTARMIQEGEVSLKDLSELPVLEAKEKLLTLCGVGQKVADCICLFALHDLKAFPVDTHIRQVLKEHYPEGFPFEKYPDTAGILQQYIFYYDLEQGGSRKTGSGE